MCDICEKWDKHEIDGKEAMGLIGNALKTKHGQRSGKTHLQTLASRILDDEVPFSETNPKAERAFWKRTHTGEENEEP